MAKHQPATFRSDRYHRQRLLPWIGSAGQDRIGSSHAVVIGCGALGTVSAEQLVRGGVGRVTLIDRDVIELTNLQRQTLYAEKDVGRPKAIAAAERLRQVNGTVTIEPVVADIDSANIEGFVQSTDVVLDGGDNAALRYLLNDACIKHRVPWIYGACVATEGRVMPVLPGDGPCLRCIFPIAPGAGELATCDTAGVLSSAASVVASLQTAAAFRVLAGRATDLPRVLTTIDLTSWRLRTVDVPRDDGCACCGRGQYEFLSIPPSRAALLCGRSAVQLRTALPDLGVLAERLSPLGVVALERPLLRFEPAGERLTLTLFADGRSIVHGTDDVGIARAAVTRYLGDV